MPRKHQVSIGIYRKHIQLFRFLNDAWIFTTLLRPHLDKEAARLRRSNSKAKKPYRVPKRDRSVTSKRTDADIGSVFRTQFQCGIFETNIVSIVSRIEVFIQECIAVAVRAYPKKLLILGEKSGLPLDLFLNHESREDVLERYIAMRCQELMFGKPSEYLDKACKVLSIEIDRATIEEYLEIKATRDVIIHNSGKINQLYIDKAGKKSRGKIGEILSIDEDYFGDVIMIAKTMSGEIQRKVEDKYG